MHRARSAPPERELRLRDVTRELTVAEAGSALLAVSRRALRLAGWDIAIECLNAAKHVRGLHVADDDEHRGRRPIEVAIETHHVIAPQTSEPLFATDAPP